MKKINGKTGLLRLAACLLVCFFNNIIPKQISQKNTATIFPKKPLLREEFKAGANKQGLLIFLDDSERDKFGPISWDFLNALYQEASPIIVSTSLLHSIFQKKAQKMEHSWLNWKAFKPEQWIIKKINDSLSLLIPLVYLKGLNVTKEQVEAFDNTENIISDTELKLGLKVNHMEAIDYKTMISSVYKYLQTHVSNYFSKPVKLLGPEFADYFTDSLDNIFCKKIDYKNQHTNIPEWFIYIDGHGWINNSIAGLSLDGFKKLLSFLEDKMNTKLLVVSSCYVAGYNANKIYGEIKLETQKYYSFPIIVQALNNITSLAKKVQFEIDFVAFFKKAKELEGKYSEIIKPISFDFIQNTPQIKLPGIEWFSVIEGDKKIVSIGSILAKTRDPQKPLDVVKFFKKDPEVILLYADDIPFELVINSSQLKAIVSMESPVMVENIVRIKKISSTQDFFDILDWFRLAWHAYNMTFFVEEIGEYKDVCIIGTSKYVVKAYYKDKNGVLFTVTNEKINPFTRIFHLLGLKKRETKIEKNSEDEKLYQERMHLIHEQYPQLSAVEKWGREEITSEQIKKIENVLIKQRERQINEAKK